jgi:hypothetical protein
MLSTLTSWLPAPFVVSAPHPPPDGTADEPNASTAVAPSSTAVPAAAPATAPPASAAATPPTVSQHEAPAAGFAAATTPPAASQHDAPPAGSVTDLLIAALAGEFERQGFSTRDDVASMSRGQLERVIEQAFSGRDGFLGGLPDSDLHSALLPDVAEAGDVVQCRALLQAGALPDARRRDGQPALLLAAQKGHVACIDCLLGARADLHATTPDGRTALHAACAAAYERAAVALVDAGASLCTYSRSGATPLALLSQSAFDALPVAFCGGAADGADASWIERPIDPARLCDVSTVMNSAREAMAVRLARYACGAVGTSGLEKGRDPSFPHQLYSQRTWSEATHAYFPPPFRRATVMLLMHCGRGAGVGGIALLPPELMLDVLRLLTRDAIKEEEAERRAVEATVPAALPMLDRRPVMLRGWPHVVAARAKAEL